MLLDYVTLLAAVGISAACLSLMIFLGWLIMPKESFLLASAAGGSLSGIGLILYGYYVINPAPLIAVAAFALILTGLSMLVGSGYQFRTGVSPRRLIIAVALISNIVALPALALGYTGLGFVPINLTVAMVFFLVCWQFWRARQEAPMAIPALCGLHGIIGLTFVLCAAMLALDGRPVIDTAPSGWAEDLSLLVMIACVPGIGAVTLTLNQARIARVHRLAAMTDPLTGLMNRRALFDAVGTQALPPQTAVIVFDIDRFKSINDDHGHGVGDLVIALFARALDPHVARGAFAARLGGEEFALILHATGADEALRFAEQVRQSFAAATARLGIDGLHCSASAGIAFCVPPGETFEQVLNEADKALYAAKKAGRDRVTPAEPRLATSNPLTPPSLRPSRL